MKFLSSAELAHHVEPLLCDSQVESRGVAIKAVFSKLCEPADTACGVFTQHLGHEELLQLLLARASAAELKKLLQDWQVEAIEQVFQQGLAQVWQASCERWLPRLNKREFLASLDQAKALGLKLVPQDSHWYPPRLEVLGAGMPLVLWTKGEVSLLTAAATVAIVGSRNTSVYGRNVATDLAVVAADHNIVTVSGGAFGIDACAHQGSLQAGGSTIAAMAGGLGRLYPLANLELLNQIGEQGLLISELPPMVAPAKWRFLKRNRLIAALGDATVVVQAGIKSGAMNTADKAAEFGRPVAVVPGQINSAYHVGCHRFANEHPNTQLVTAVAELPYLLPGRMGGPELQGVAAGLGALETRALDAFVPGENAFEKLLKESGLTASEGAIALGSLELEGLIKRVGSGYQRVGK
jgi:DNA processing protein